MAGYRPCNARRRGDSLLATLEKSPEPAVERLLRRARADRLDRGGGQPREHLLQAGMLADGKRDDVTVFLIRVGVGVFLLGVA